MKSYSNRLQKAAGAAALAALLAPGMFAQTTPAPDAATMQQLLQRINALEQQVKDLKSGQGAAEAEPSVTREVYPKVQFSAQGDVDFKYSSARDEKSSFFVGDFDPLIVAKLSERANVLGDFIISDDNAEGFSIEIERLIAHYTINDYFNVEAGRFNTDIGWYNNTFHNGTYFQTTVDRPTVYDFEDDGGILPIHMNGVSLNGDIPSGAARLHYNLTVGNGRSYDTNWSTFAADDNNDYKAVNISLYARPTGLPGLQVGTSLYHDTVANDQLPRTDQWIGSLYGIYRTPYFEWYNEGVIMRDSPRHDESHTTFAGYTQVSKKFGALRPYLRFNFRKASASDPLLANIGANYTEYGPTVGVRYDFTPMMAVKLEYEHRIGSQVLDSDTLTAQWTFRF
ncbi:MAG TPA: hypothetical protein VHB20_07920 [Verrucomicrobiae bacterium]|jgi:hypothetical protein|nr:hypothetical protein [Verrucomicrobiae bacterium]